MSKMIQVMSSTNMVGSVDFDNTVARVESVSSYHHAGIKKETGDIRHIITAVVRIKNLGNISVALSKNVVGLTEAQFLHTIRQIHLQGQVNLKHWRPI